MSTRTFIDVFTEELTGDFQASSMILEAFSNWKYDPPKDPEKLLYDFYFFTLFLDKVDTKDEKFNFALKEAAEDATDNLQKHMLKALKFANIAELRHIFDSTRGSLMSRIDDEEYDEYKLSDNTKKFIKAYRPRARYFEDYERKNKRNKFVPKKIAKQRLTGPLKGETKKSRPHSERVDSYKAIYATQKELGLSNHELSLVAKELFNKLKWYMEYGGKAWGKIANAWGKVITAKTTKEKVKWIDHAYDLQHNTDTVFNKLKLYFKDGSGYEWLRRALDWKRDVSDVRGFYKKVSPQLQSVVAYAAKNIFGKSMDKYDDDSPERVWDMGTLTNQTWKGGLWRWGTFEGGTWEKGTWKNGIWKSGVWKDGTWKDGIWHNGTWKGGTWEHGRWEDGLWLDGRFEAGTWQNGRWKGGTWISGDWEGGKVWSKKYNAYVKSSWDPHIFNAIEKETETLKELRAVAVDD